MKNKNFYLSSKTVDISENDLYLEITNRLCYYDDSNLNDVMLPYKDYEDSAEEFAKTLINMPVQAKYRKINNQDDLGGHECVKKPNGEVVFNTESIGVHTSVEIKDDNVTTVHGEEKTLPCLFATARIWKRNENIVNAIKRLFSEDKLNSSWEISTEEYVYKNGIKILTKYSFFANTLLGSLTTPAYNGTSTTLNLSQFDEDELMIAEAITKDLIANDGVIDISNESNDTSDISTITNILNKNKEAVMDNIENKETVSEELENKVLENSEEEITDSECNNNPDVDKSEDNSKETKTSEDEKEISSLTTEDIYEKVSKACKEKIDSWGWIYEIFPEEHEVWFKEWTEGTTSLDYLVFTYTITDDEVTVSEPQKATLTMTIKEVSAVINKLNKEISEKNDAIIKSNEIISSKESEISELTIYKDKFEKAEQERIIAEQKLEEERIIAETLEKKNELKKYAISSKMISEEEFETSEEIKSMIENLDKDSIKGIIADRVIASLETKEVSKTVDTSEAQDKNVTINLSSVDDEINEKLSAVKDFLKR